MVLLPGGSFCGSCGCDDGNLPYTITVTPSGMTKDTRITDTGGLPGYFRSCFGDGAFAQVETKIGDPAAVNTVRIFDGGHGYAVRGRIEPTLAIAVPGLRAAACEFTPTLSEIQLLECSECLVAWGVDSVAITKCDTGTDDGYGVADFPATVTPGEGVHMLSPAVVKLRVARAEPTVEASITSVAGSGASLEVSLAYSETLPNNDYDPHWYVESVAVTSPGTTYRDLDAVVLSTPHYEAQGGGAVARTKIAAPQKSGVSVASFSGGFGAKLQPTFTKTTATEDPGFTVDRYTLSGVTILAGGSGYAVGDQVHIVPDADSKGARNGVAVPPPHVSSVNANGAITGVAVTPNVNCLFWVDAGEVESVELIENGGGRYYRQVPSEFIIDDPGQYYAESDDAEPCVSEAWFDIPVSPVPEGLIGAVVGEEPGCDLGAIVGTTLGDGEYPIQSYADFMNDCFVEPRVGIAAETDPTVEVTLTAQYGSGAYVAYGYGGTRCGVHNHYDQMRLPPVKVTAATASGEFGEFIVTLEQTTEPALPTQSRTTNPAWRIASIEAIGGCGFVDGEAMQFSALVSMSTAGSSTLHTFDPQAKLLPPFDKLECATLHVVTPPAATVTADENGTPTGATITEPGLFYVTWPWDGEPVSIDQLTVTDGGSGYAVLGREQPQNVGFSPAGPWTPSFEQDADEFGRPYWSISGIAVGVGSGFTDGQALTTTQGWPEMVGEPLRAVIRTQRIEPVLEASIVDGSLSGSGCVLAVALRQISASPPAWEVARINVVSGGQRYLTLDKHVRIAFASGHTGRAIADASATATIGPNGVVTRVAVDTGGQYYGLNDVADSVEIASGGRLWRENKALPPYVATATASISPDLPHNGSGVALGSVIIDDNPYSETFGEVLRVVITNPGSGYLPFARRRSACRWYFYGPAGTGAAGGGATTGGGHLIKGANDLLPHTYSIFPIDAPPLEPDIRVPPKLSTGRMHFVFPVSVLGGQPAYCHLTSDEPVEECADLSGIVLDGLNVDGTVTVDAGGTFAYTELQCATDPSNCPPDGKRPFDLAATATVTFEVPVWEDVAGGGLGLPTCLAGQWSLADFNAGFSCTENDWLAATVALEQPAGAMQNYSLTCAIKVGCVDGEMYLTVAFEADCRELYGFDDPDGPFERRLYYLRTQSPITYTVDGDGYAVPDDIENLDITIGPSEVSDNVFPATISIAFNRNG